MRRILLYSLLSACVLGGLPRDYYDYDYNDSNSTNAGDDEENDRCSLAAPLYFPLRRSESFYKRFRDDILEGANSEANYIEERIQRWTKRDREFRYRSTFQYPEEAEFSYKDTIALGTRYYLTYTDIFHSYISWGDFSEAEDFRGRYGWSLNRIAMAEKLLDELVSNLSDDRNRKRYQNTMKNVVKLIKPETWPYLASCLFEAFKENQDSSTLSQAVTDLVSDEDFEKFNRYFKYHVGSIAMALKRVLESEDTIEMIQLIYELTKSELKSIDYNHLQSTLYYFVLQLKTVLMKPDIKELWTSLNQTQYFIDESVWKFTTGRWPEMATFVDNFLRRTAGSIVFWDRLTGQFITEMKNKIPEMKKKIPDSVDNVVENLVENFDEHFESYMYMIADGDEDSIRQLFKDIRRSKWDETITSYIEILGDHLTSCNMAILASKLPSWDDIKSTVINNPFFQPIKTLLFQNWPQDEIYPDSIEDFLRRIYDTRLSYWTGLDWTGPSTCEDDDKAPHILTV